MQAAGLAAPASDCWNLPMEFASWTARMRTPTLRADAVRDVLAQAPQEARQHFAVQPDGSFRIDVAWLQTRPLR